MSQARAQKRMREKAREDKARAKRQRKEERAAGAEGLAERDVAPTTPQTEVLAELAHLHERFEAGEVDFDEFEQRKHELLAQIAV